MTTNWLTLLTAGGFIRVGYWKLDEAKRARFHPEAEVPTEPGVYAYAVNGEIRYVGSAQRGIRKRLRKYEITEDPRTAFRIRSLITKELKKGHEVTFLAIVPDAILWKSLPIDPIAGLEEGLIRAIRPAWNIRGLGALPKKASPKIQGASAL